MTDSEAISEFAAAGSQAAFELLVSRYVNLVYSAAYRQIGFRADAEDVTQDVFSVLARKAPSLAGHRLLGPWLLRVTRHVSLDHLKRETRWRRREQRAAIMKDSTEPAVSESPWREMVPLLDAAIASLSETDRQAVLLRFFQGLDDHQSAEVLQMNQNTLRQRRFRALARMRAYFAARGVNVATEVMTSAISAGAITRAPEALASRVVSHVMTLGQVGAATTAGAGALVKGAIVMSWLKANLVAVVIIVVLLCAGSGLMLANYVGNGSVDSVAVTRGRPLERRPLHDRFAPGEKIPARAYASKVGAQDFPGGMGYLDAGSYLRYANVDFGDKSCFFVTRLAVPADLAGKQIVVHIDRADGPVVCRLTVQSTGGWGHVVTQSAPLNPVQGVHDVYLGFTGSGVANLYQLQFTDALPQAAPTTRLAATRPVIGL
jgi:RNA polymerase sigma factor (sigma-70 family)